MEHKFLEKQLYFDIFCDSIDCCSRSILNDGSVKRSIVKKKNPTFVDLGPPMQLIMNHILYETHESYTRRMYFYQQNSNLKIF